MILLNSLNASLNVINYSLIYYSLIVNNILLQVLPLCLCVLPVSCEYHSPPLIVFIHPSHFIYIDNELFVLHFISCLRARNYPIICLHHYAFYERNNSDVTLQIKCQHNCWYGGDFSLSEFSVSLWLEPV